MFRGKLIGTEWRLKQDPGQYTEMPDGKTWAFIQTVLANFYPKFGEI